MFDILFPKTSVTVCDKCSFSILCYKSDINGCILSLDQLSHLLYRYCLHRKTGKMNAPAASSPIAAIRPVLHPRRLMIVDSFIASPPTAIAMLSTGYVLYQKLLLDTGRSGISTTAAPRHNTSNFFSTLFISPSVITK